MIVWEIRPDHVAPKWWRLFSGDRAIARVYREEDAIALALLPAFAEIAKQVARNGVASRQEAAALLERAGWPL